MLTFGASVALESSCGCAFSLAEPSRMDGSSLNNSLDPVQYKYQQYQIWIENKVIKSSIVFIYLQNFSQLIVRT